MCNFAQQIKNGDDTEYLVCSPWWCHWLCLALYNIKMDKRCHRRLFPLGHDGCEHYRMTVHRTVLWHDRKIRFERRSHTVANCRLLRRLYYVQHFHERKPIPPPLRQLRLCRSLYRRQRCHWSVCRILGETDFRHCT